jgi:hypothetical protein
MTRAVRAMSSKCEPGSHPGLVSVSIRTRAVLADAAQIGAPALRAPQPLEIE